MDINGLYATRFFTTTPRRRAPLSIRPGRSAVNIRLAALLLPPQKTPPMPLHQPDGMITQVAAGCGVGRTRVNRARVARTTKRPTRRPQVWGAGSDRPYCAFRLQGIWLRRGIRKYIDYIRKITPLACGVQIRFAKFEFDAALRAVLIEERVWA